MMRYDNEKRSLAFALITHKNDNVKVRQITHMIHNNKMYKLIKSFYKNVIRYTKDYNKC